MVVGLAAVELGKCLGARVIAAASSEAKLERCRSRGATQALGRLERREVVGKVVLVP